MALSDNVSWTQSHTFVFSWCCAPSNSKTQTGLPGRGSGSHLNFPSLSSHSKSLCSRVSIAGTCSHNGLNMMDIGLKNDLALSGEKSCIFLKYFVSPCSANAYHGSVKMSSGLIGGSSGSWDNSRGSLNCIHWRLFPSCVSLLAFLVHSDSGLIITEHIARQRWEIDWHLVIWVMSLHLSVDFWVFESRKWNNRRSWRVVAVRLRIMETSWDPPCHPIHKQKMLWYTQCSTPTKSSVRILDLQCLRTLEIETALRQLNF